MEAKVQKVLNKLQWMREKKIWPNGLRYLWTDAHGVCALLTLYYELKVIYFKKRIKLSETFLFPFALE